MQRLGSHDVLLGKPVVLDGCYALYQTLGFDLVTPELSDIGKILKVDGCPEIFRTISMLGDLERLPRKLLCLWQVAARLRHPGELRECGGTVGVPVAQVAILNLQRPVQERLGFI